MKKLLLILVVLSAVGIAAILAHDTYVNKMSALGTKHVLDSTPSWSAFWNTDNVKLPLSYTR